ncbi:hypothetical protein K8O68_02515 [Salipaludibacillus sp. CUR1]|uniref:hypothetical protein n=1 Tax=Salipaludibacillus sp. CUR1 TaxID=2820003 RepID=UPI001E3DA2D8|nr:hypothetical protein [Salipaludibacillus sp. CUR1]
MNVIPFFIGIVFIFLHLMANYLLPAERIKRLIWFSFSGGLAVSYVFVYLLPTLHQEQANIEEKYRALAMESEIYFVGLLGVVVFLGIQLIVRRKDVSHTSSFWVAVAFYTFYNALISFTVLSVDVVGVQALFYSIAIGLHIIAVAHDMYREFPNEYSKKGRYILAGGIVIGWIFALTVELNPLIKAIVFAFISGAMIFNVFKNELPNEKEIHYFTFTIGVFSYTVLTMSLKFFFEW